MCVCQAGGARYVLCVRVCVCVRGGAGRGDSCLDSERRSRGFVVHRTLRPLERGVVLLGVCSVCVCVCEDSPGGLYYCIDEEKGVVLAGPHAAGTSPCL